MGDNIVNNLNQLNLNNEDPDVFDGRTMNNIRSIPGGYRNELIDDITEDEIEDFNGAHINIGRELDNFYNDFGEHGSLNCGKKGYPNYKRIQQTCRELDANVDDTTKYALILHFILRPLTSLPEIDDNIKAMDGLGEKTYSKKWLNRAAILSLERWNFVEGYWQKRQQEFE